MRISVKSEIEARKAEGNFFRKDVTKTIMGNALDMVEWLVEEGAKQMRAGRARWARASPATTSRASPTSASRW